MRFSEAWLREWVDPPIDTQQLADQLSMAGLEVDAIEPAAAPFSGVVVGRVAALEAHPNAVKLRICSVEIGGGEPLQIICGAPNVTVGMKVPVATVGARLPGDFKIKKAKLRGVESFGMICSTSELGLTESSDGIWPLPSEAPLGADLRDWLELDDQCIEVDLTPDRGDCLGLAGLAREVAVLNRAPLTPPAMLPVAARNDQRFAVEVQAPQACPRYACRVVSGIDPAATTPLWLCERLRRGGIRPISPVVDVTNYVLLELGQPMHAFDLARLEGGIQVRMATADETLELLNGEQLDLRTDTLVIADARRALALAGIMGGAGSGVGEATTDILLESAFFNPVAISGKARGYGLHTDSSHRFERGVDPQLQVPALERATALLLQIAGGEPGPVVMVESPEHLPIAPTLHLRAQRVGQVLGITLPDVEIVEILERLGMAVEPADGGWKVTPPSARFDLVEDVDLIADIGRIHGYDTIPVRHAISSAGSDRCPEARLELDRARLLLVDRGFNEVITYSFVSERIQALIDPDTTPLRLANPLSAELALMRTSLWAGLLQAGAYNQARQQGRLQLFESGLRFRPQADGLQQTPALAGLVSGARDPEQWGLPARAVDFYDIKADVEAVLALTGDGARIRFVPDDTHPALHPGQSARIERDGVTLGVLGMLHPSIAAQLDFSGDVFLFELDLEPLSEGVLPRYESISRFPTIRRDLAIVIGEEVAFSRVADCIRAAAPELLREIVLFDVYAGENIDTGCKSLAIGLILQSASRTLTDELIEGAVERIVARLQTELSARLRD